MSEKLEGNAFDPGELVFDWEAHDYHPHQRGILWYVIFISIFFGGSAWAVISDPKWGWVTSFSFCVTAGTYFLVHRNGNEEHEIRVYEKGLLIDETNFVGWGKMEGFWFNVDETVSVVNFELQEKNKKITLQLGHVSAEKLRSVLVDFKDVPELKEKKEGLMDLWVRALKL